MGFFGLCFFFFFFFYIFWGPDGEHAHKVLDAVQCIDVFESVPKEIDLIVTE